MSRSTNLNLAQSVQDRLRDRAEKEGRPFAELLQYFGLERFLFRLSQSSHRDRFILKGALLIRMWEGVTERPTRDIDLLGPANLGTEDLDIVIRDCMVAEVSPDGLEFDPASIRIQEIRAGARYPGYRAKFQGRLGRARLHFQVDVGAGDEVVPAPVLVTYPVLLGFPEPCLKAYTPCTVIAEKFHTIIHLGEVNSRMKDYFDLYVLSQNRSINSRDLVSALEATFRIRNTEMPDRPPPGLQATFAALPDKQMQWKAFLHTNELGDGAPSLEAVLERVRDFLMPVVNAARERKSHLMIWTPGGPWTQASEVADCSREGDGS